MSSAGPQTKHRDACDACHRRKVRCTVNSPGACVNCQNGGRTCTFSPRDDMGRPKKSRARTNTAAQKVTAAPPSPSPSLTHLAFEPTQSPAPNHASSLSQDLFMQDDFGILPSTLECNFASWAYSPSSRLPGGDDYMGQDLAPWSPNQQHEFHAPGFFGNGDFPITSTPMTSDYTHNGALPTPSSTKDHRPESSSRTSERGSLSDNSDDKEPQSLSQATQRLTSILFDLQSELIATTAMGAATAADGSKIVSFANSLCDLLFSDTCGPNSKLDIVGDVKLWSLISTAVAILLNLCRSFCNQSFDGSIEPSLRTNGELFSGPSSMAFRTDRLALLACMDYQFTVFEKNLRTPICETMPNALSMLQGVKDTKDYVQYSIQQMMRT